MSERNLSQWNLIDDFLTPYCGDDNSEKLFLLIEDLFDIDNISHDIPRVVEGYLAYFPVNKRVWMIPDPTDDSDSPVYKPLSNMFKVVAWRYQ